MNLLFFSGVVTKKTMVSKTKMTTTAGGEKTTAGKTQVIETMEPVVVNGENKITDEETSVEVIDKCAVEDIMQVAASAEKILTENSSLTVTSSEQMVTTTETTTTEVIVNGDHH